MSPHVAGTTLCSMALSCTARARPKKRHVHSSHETVTNNVKCSPRLSLLQRHDMTRYDVT